MQARREWTSTNRGKKVKNWVHRSAFLHRPLLSLFWHGALQELIDEGEINYAKWLVDPQRGGHLRIDEATGLITALWQRYLAAVEPPFATYNQNATESIWRSWI